MLRTRQIHSRARKLKTYLMASKPASLMVMLERELKNKPMDDIVRRLAEAGSVDTLTELKIALVDEACKAVPIFQKVNSILGENQEEEVSTLHSRRGLRLILQCCLRLLTPVLLHRKLKPCSRHVVRIVNWQMVRFWTIFVMNL